MKPFKLFQIVYSIIMMCFALGLAILPIIGLLTDEFNKYMEMSMMCGCVAYIMACIPVYAVKEEDES